MIALVSLMHHDVLLLVSAADSKKLAQLLCNVIAAVLLALCLHPDRKF